MQPAFLPWLGYFDRLARSDHHIVLDHVALDRNSKTKFVNRNRIRTREGWIWLTVPILTHGPDAELAIDRIRISDDGRSAAKMWRSVEASYGRARYFATYAEGLREQLLAPADGIADLDRRVTGLLLAALGIDRPLHYSGAMAVTERKADLILALCRQLGASSYISGPFGRDYLDPAAFREAGIELLFHDYRHPQYAQAFPGFEPYMSVIDLLFNHGPESRHILSAGQELSRT
jgi:hypothetical protein